MTKGKRTDKEWLMDNWLDILLLLILLLSLNTNCKADTVNAYIGVNKEINDQLDIGVTFTKFSDRFDPEASSTKVGPYVSYKHNENVKVRYGIKSGSSTEYNVNFVSHNISVNIDL